MTEILNAEDLADRLRVEFKDDAQDRLEIIYRTVKAFEAAPAGEAEALVALQREASKLKGIGSTCGYPLVNLIAHRLEVYLAGVKTLREREIADVLKFADRMAEAVDKEERPDVARTNQIIRALPVRYEFDISHVEVRDVEIMLVTPSKVVSRLLSTEMQACGYRSVVVHDPVEALGLAVRNPPGMVMASATMEPIGGLDLLRGLKAMSVTAAVPMALLTSLDVPSRDLPRDVAAVRTGGHFGEDFATAIARFNLG
ncbi:Hpt domain-containing protein [Arenibaculum pallidiluteum]|uniref:Hpt domain-containing protein n=1 Tax=Arenibaculum pallidiluteum TaxID=2812559 RepID=UPI001A96B2B6|nr:Hpt domain-containing protein [Arenibaculum pallidiluteum]